MHRDSVTPGVFANELPRSRAAKYQKAFSFYPDAEHRGILWIKKDKLEIKKAAQKLQKRGCLIVLAPAHQYLYSPFDAKIGHFRRYHQKRLIAISPANTKLLRVRYLDCVGCLASLGNKVILRAGIPTKNQIIMWDRLMVPLSRIFDSVFGHKIGKSIYIVWQKT